MNICIISSRFYPQLVGSGTSAFVIASELCKRGHNVTVLTDMSLKDEPSHRALGFSIEYVNALEDFATGKSGFRNALADIHKHIDQLSPDIVHVCNFMPMLLLSMIRSEIKCPIAFTFFNTPVIDKRAAGYLSDATLDISLGAFIIGNNAYDGLILGSEHYVKAALSLGADPEKIQISHLAPDLGSFDVSNGMNASDDKTVVSRFIPENSLADSYILLPSRITAQKGIIEAIEALSVVNNSRERPQKLLLTGMASPFDSQYAEEVWKKIDEHNLREHVLVPNKRIDRQSLASFFRLSKLVVIPSWYEGLGLAAIEAQYLGVPLAASDTTGLNEVVTDGENGITFAPYNGDAMAKAILKIVNNEIDIESIVERAKQTVKKFSLDRHIDDLEDAYGKLIKDYKHGQ